MQKHDLRLTKFIKHSPTFQTNMHFYMQSLTQLPMELPDDMAGNWRITLIAEFGDEGKSECFRVKFDLVEG